MSWYESRLKQTIIGLLEAAMALTVVFSIATTFGQWHRLLELFSHFRLQYLGVSVLLTLAFLLMKWRNYTLLGLATVAFNGWFVLPWYLPANNADVAESDLTILLANVQVSNDSADRFLALVADEQPDVIVIQEATPDWLGMIAAIHADYPHRVGEPREDPFGIALYSRLPLDSSAINASAPMGFPDIAARIRLGEGYLNLISTHPLPPLGAANYSSRNVQLDGVARLASRTPGPLVVIGDLNISMWAHHYQRLVAIAGLENAREGFGVKPTWPLFLPFAMIPIDHCLVSTGISVVAFDTGPPIGSDHLPILVSLAID